MISVFAVCKPTACENCEGTAARTNAASELAKKVKTAAPPLLVKDVGVVSDEAETDVLSTCIKLNNGVAMPWVGIGMYRQKAAADITWHHNSGFQARAARHFCRIVSL